MAFGMAVYLIDRTQNKEELFRLSSENASLFRTSVKTTAKCVIEPKDHADYRIIRIALDHLSTGRSWYGHKSLLDQLAAGHKYSCELKKRAEEYLIKQLIGELELEQVEGIYSAAQECSAWNVVPFVLSGLIYSKEPVSKESRIDPKLIQLASKFRTVKDLSEARRQIQTGIQTLEEKMLWIRNRFDEVPNPKESEILSSLKQSLEEMRTHYINYVRKDKSLNFKELILGYDKTDNLDLLAHKLQDARNALNELENTRPEIMSENQAKALLTQLEAELASHMQTLEQMTSDEPRPDKFFQSSFILTPGMELGYVDGEIILWLSEDKFSSVDSNLVMELIDTVSIDHLAVGSEIKRDEPKSAYWSHFGIDASHPKEEPDDNSDSYT